MHLQVTELQTHLVETDLECKKLEGQAYELDKKLRKQVIFMIKYTLC